MTTTQHPRRHGAGSQRERRPGVWEVRVPAAADPATGRYRQHSVTVHGSEADADTRRMLLIDQQANHPNLPSSTRSTLGQLLPTWLDADHPWKPSTRVGYRSVVRGLLADPIADVRVVALTPRTVRAALTRWQARGASLAVVGGRFRVLRSALGWAYDERLLDQHPTRLMRGPARPSPRSP
jgi:hypothetical protein